MSADPEPELKITLGPTRTVLGSPPGDGGAARPALEPPRASPTRSSTRMLAVMAGIAAAALVVAGVAVGIYLGSQEKDDGNMKGKPTPEVEPPAPQGLSAEESRLSTIFLEAHWVEEDVVIDDTEFWTCSGVIVADEGDSLVAMTNSHCLGLATIVDGQPETPDIKKYAVFASVHGSKDRIQVTRFAECDNSGMDVALVRMPKGAMRNGRDFSVAPIAERSSAEVGRDTVAIGAPRGLRGTETFGRISALRLPGEVGSHEVLQTDTAMNPGNSGGPLFVVLDGRRHLVGLSTFGRDGEGLNFAFYADEFSRQEWQWFDATAAGAAAALRTVYRIDADVAP